MCPPRWLPPAGCLPGAGCGIYPPAAAHTRGEPSSWAVAALDLEPLSPGERTRWQVWRGVSLAVPRFPPPQPGCGLTGSGPGSPSAGGERGSCRQLKAVAAMPGGAAVRSLKWVHGEGEAVGLGRVWGSGAQGALAGFGGAECGTGRCPAGGEDTSADSWGPSDATRSSTAWLAPPCWQRRGSAALPAGAVHPRCTRGTSATGPSAGGAGRWVQRGQRSPRTPGPWGAAAARSSEQELLLRGGRRMMKPRRNLSWQRAGCWREPPGARAPPAPPPFHGNPTTGGRPGWGVWRPPGSPRQRPRHAPGVVRPHPGEPRGRRRTRRGAGLRPVKLASCQGGDARVAAQAAGEAAVAGDLQRPGCHVRG